VTSCSLALFYLYVEEICCFDLQTKVPEDGGSKFLRKGGNSIDHEPLRPRRKIFITAVMRTSNLTIPILVWKSYQQTYVVNLMASLHIQTFYRNSGHPEFRTSYSFSLLKLFQRTCVTFYTWWFFLRLEVIRLSSTTKLEDQSLSAVRYWLFDVWGPSPPSVT
jgi:hypothetical protein